jgi:hypothetical protein
MTFHPDEAIEMERRHIREGEARIAQQEEIVSRLDSRVGPESTLLARQLLVGFRDVVEAAKERLSQLERRYPDKPPGLN